MMDLLIFKSTWGMTEPLEAQVDQISLGGYDGIEQSIFDKPTTAELLPLVEGHGLKLVAITVIPTIEQLDPMLRRLAEFHPEKIVVHSGRDSMSRDDGSRFFEEALRVEEAIGIPVMHETHRRTLLFTPWDTAFYLRKFDNLKLCADLSHWVVVCGRFPDDHAEDIALALERTGHIHGRVGQINAAQVTHPAAPEWADYLEWHERQWRRIADHHRQRNQPTMTFTPEYGPPLYMPTLPFTNAPVADLWAVCQWAAQRARETLA